MQQLSYVYDNKNPHYIKQFNYIAYVRMRRITKRKQKIACCIKTVSYSNNLSLWLSLILCYQNQVTIFYRCKYNIPIYALNKIFTQSELCVNKEPYYQRFKIICILLEVKSLKNDFIETRSAKLILLLYILKFVKDIMDSVFELEDL